MDCPPNHSDLSPSSISVPRTVHDLLSNYRSYSVHDWLQTLLKTAASDQTTPPLTYHVKKPTAATPNTTSNPFVDVSDDLPAPNVPQIIGNEYYIRISRSIAVSGFLSRVGVIHRNAFDVITVIPDYKINDSTISCQSWLPSLPSVVPDLVGISKIISFVSNIQPKDSISSPQCCHFTRTLYRVIETMFIHPWHWWKDWENSSSIKNTETIVALLRTAQRHEEVAAKVLAEADRDTGRASRSEGAVSDPSPSSPSDSTPLITL
ncbi:hypothetical protein BU15DRAFT_65608 [Melanogaster broomeanus]|nr:hypothetical protein BU15DRAFT_65608 [Melanogaster broomeanus]